MMTPDQLSDLLRGVNVRDVSKLAGVSTKTIYRLRNQECANGRTEPISPNLRTVEKLITAVKQIKRKRAPAERMSA